MRSGPRGKASLVVMVRCALDMVRQHGVRIAVCHRRRAHVHDRVVESGNLVEQSVLHLIRDVMRVGQ